MDDTNQGLNQIPRGLVKRGRTWHVCRVFDGKMVRVSTGCSDLNSAQQVLNRIEQTYLTKNVTEWWKQQIELGRQRRGWLKDALSRARSRRDCDLTLGQIIALAEACSGQCTVSGMPFSDAVYGRRRPFIPSLDRIDSTKGYSINNCRFVCLIVNYGMSDFGEEAYKKAALALAMKELQKIATP